MIKYHSHKKFKALNQGSIFKQVHRVIKFNQTAWIKPYIDIYKLSYYKVFHRKPISNRNEKNSDLMNKLIYLGLSILDMSKTVMYKVCYDYVKSKYSEDAKLCYMDTDASLFM